jgi:hypothetical protein
MMFFPPLSARVTDNLTTDPDKAPFIYQDIETFLAAFKKIAPGKDPAKILQTEYLDKGTPGLKIFIEKYGLTAEKLVAALQIHRKKYAALNEILKAIKAEIPEFRRAFARLKKYIPSLVIPPTYFLVAGFRGIGSGSVKGQLISVEKWKKPITNKKTLLVHELVHFQQGMAVGVKKYMALFGPEKNLLGLCIREGTAEFFSNLVTGEITQEGARSYVLKNEKALWNVFRTEMSGRETKDWMWKKPKNPEQPPHVGYVMGFLIVKSYYDQAADKTKAVQEILSVTDYPAFLKKSQYENRFKE